MNHLNQIIFPLNPNYNLDLQTDQVPIKAAAVSQFQASYLISLNKSFIDEDLRGKNSTIAILDTGIYPYHDVFTNNGNNSWNEKIIAFYDAFEQKKNPRKIFSGTEHMSHQ